MPLSVSVEFAGGAELLFDKIKTHNVILQDRQDSQPWTLELLISWVAANLLKERPELFVLGNSVRPGILVLVNNTDWEILGQLNYQLQDNDSIEEKFVVAVMEDVAALLRELRIKIATFCTEERSNTQACTLALSAIEKALTSPTRGLGIKWLDPLGCACSAPAFPGTPENEPALGHALRAAWEELSWKTPAYLDSSFIERLGAGHFKSAMIVGHEQYGSHFHSEDTYVGLVWVEAGVSYPMHAHHADEFIVVLSPSHSTWFSEFDPLKCQACGGCSLSRRVANPGDILHHLSCTPHGVNTGGHPLLVLYVWYGNGIHGGKYWFLGDGNCSCC